MMKPLTRHIRRTARLNRRTSRCVPHATMARLVRCISRRTPRMLAPAYCLASHRQLSSLAPKGTADNAFYGIAIGAIVAAGAYAVGPISFAAFNPAVTLSLCINGFLPWNALPVYWLTQAVAAVAAGLLFKSMGITQPEELRGSM